MYYVSMHFNISRWVPRNWFTKQGLCVNMYPFIIFYISRGLCARGVLRSRHLRLRDSYTAQDVRTPPYTTGLQWPLKDLPNTRHSTKPRYAVQEEATPRWSSWPSLIQRSFLSSGLFSNNPTGRLSTQTTMHYIPIQSTFVRDSLSEALFFAQKPKLPSRAPDAKGFVIPF